MKNLRLSENSRGNNRNKHMASKVDWLAKHGVPESGDQAWKGFLLDGQSDPFAYAVIGIAGSRSKRPANLPQIRTLNHNVLSFFV